MWVLHPDGRRSKHHNGRHADQSVSPETQASDRARRRLYQRCTAVFLVKFALAAVVMVSLYLAGSVVGLGVATIVLSAPALAACVYLCWRMVRVEQASGGIPARGRRIRHLDGATLTKEG